MNSSAEISMYILNNVPFTNIWHRTRCTHLTLLEINNIVIYLIILFALLIFTHVLNELEGKLVCMNDMYLTTPRVDDWKKIL